MIIKHNENVARLDLMGGWLYCSSIELWEKSEMINDDLEGDGGVDDLICQNLKVHKKVTSQ